MGIAEALKAVQERIKSSAIKAGRNPDDIKLVAVTKTVGLPDIIDAVKAGVIIFGENRVQEASKKIHDARSMIQDAKWHLIGSLQKNKAKTAVQLFDLIQSVDSISLAEEINKQAENINKTQRILVQVKLSEEETKHGIPEEDLLQLLENISGMEHLKLEGLMTIPPLFDDPENTRPYFRRLRQLRDNINSSRITHYALQELSMGMSDDLEIAIEEGATMVRIGTAIFGERDRRFNHI